MLGRLVKPITPANLPDEKVREVLAELFDLLVSNKVARWELVEFSRLVDREGVAIPELAIEAYSKTDPDVYSLAILAGGYSLNSEAWRRISIAALQQAGTESERRGFYPCLVDSSFSYSGVKGVVPEVFVQRVNSAERAAESEQDPLLRGFWRWRLERTRRELEREQESIKEEFEE